MYVWPIAVVKSCPVMRTTTCLIPTPTFVGIKDRIATTNSLPPLHETPQAKHSHFQTEVVKFYTHFKTKTILSIPNFRANLSNSIPTFRQRDTYLASYRPELSNSIFILDQNCLWPHTSIQLLQESNLPFVCSIATEYRYSPFGGRKLTSIIDHKTSFPV